MFSQNFILPANGGVRIQFDFNLVLFRRQVLYELMVGSIRYSDESDILGMVFYFAYHAHSLDALCASVSVQFYEDIFILKENLQEPCIFYVFAIVLKVESDNESAVIARRS